MRIFADLGADTATPRNPDTVEVQIERKWWTLESIARMCNFIFAEDTDSYLIWLEFPGMIQGLRVKDDGGDYVEIIFKVLNDKNSKNPVFKNLNPVKVSQFEAGKNYLIPLSAGNVTDMMPPNQVVQIEGSVDSVFIPTHYDFRCAKTTDILNYTEFDAIMYDLDLKAYDDTILAHAQSKGQEMDNYLLALKK